MKIVKQILLLALAAGLGLGLVGCQPSDPSSPKVAKLSSIVVAPSSATLQVGAMQSLAVIATFSDGSTRDVSFTSKFASDDSSVATVSATGLVTAVKTGTAKITATNSGKTATSTVTVAPLRVVSISVTPAPLSLAPAGTQQLTVTGTFNDGSKGNVTAGSTFDSDNTDVATVSATGLVTAVADGTATITARHTASGTTSTSTVTVSASGGGPTPLPGGIWSSNYSQLDPAHWLSTEGGAAGTYIDTSVPTQYWWNGVAPSDATPNFYFGYGINSNAKPWGFGAYVSAPGNMTADVSGYTSLKIAVWGNDELMNTHPTLTVLLQGPDVGGCKSQLKGTIAVTAAGVQTYTLALGGFTLETPCGYASAAQALAAGILEIHVQVLGTNVQYVTVAAGTVNDYANGLNIGPISFTSMTAPTTAAPTPPARNASDVLSVYSDAYAQIAGVNLNPNWGQSTVVTEELVAGNKTQKYATLNYQGIDWASSPIDVSAMTRLHVDLWTANVTTVLVSVISAGKENAVTLSPTAAGWNSFDIDMAQYTAADKTAVIQLKFEGTPAGGTLYLDNIYFWKPAGGGGGATAPSTAAPTPPVRSASDVLSVYSDAYAQIAGVNLNPNWGQSTVVTEELVAGNKTQKYATLNYQGIDWASSPIDVSAMTRLHVDFWTANVTTVLVSVISAGKENAVTLSPTAAGWNSFDIDMAQYTVADKTAVIQLKFEGTPAGGTLYLDNIYFWKPAGGGGGAFNGTWASNYSQVDASNWKSAEGGDAGTYIDTSVATQYWWNGVAPGDATPNFYFGYGINSGAKPWGFGAYVKAPANGTVDVTAYSNLKIAVWGNDELMNTHPNLTVILKGPVVGGCTSELKGNIAVTAPGAQNYTLPLSGFSLQTPCGYATAAQALAAGVAEIHVQVLGANVQYVTVAGGTVSDYANGLNVGPISFN
ncbi:MAG: Ig-like domain-containing protein [Steroidobacteraceae bacterium]